ncbi:nuclear transport factor 2 family protein [Paenarthrobacter sp. NPDC057981]|uniref:nuclear transport factor 2 family protein n=1 Tax=Paenarthrobacter sp. NPDC057981 TaxID=3346297 RepID=UPI0036DF0B91
MNSDLNATPEVTRVEDVIRGLEQRRIAALATEDYDVLEELFEPSGVYCHSSGRVDRLADYVAALRGGSSKYSEPAYDIQSIVATASAAHVWGGFSTKVIRGNDTLVLDVLKGVTWILVDDNWRIVAVQTTRKQLQE